MMRRNQQHQHQHHQDQQSRIFYELSALVLNLLRSPPVPFSDQVPAIPPSTLRRSSSSTSSMTTQITPAGFASLLLGISVALMLSGSVTFFIGFLLMPWVLGLVMVFYVAGIASAISMLGRSLLCHVMPPEPSSPRKDIPSWKRM